MKGRDGNKEFHLALRDEQTGGGNFMRQCFGPLNGEVPLGTGSKMAFSCGEVFLW